MTQKSTSPAHDAAEKSIKQASAMVKHLWRNSAKSTCGIYSQYNIEALILTLCRPRVRVSFPPARGAQGGGGGGVWWRLQSAALWRAPLDCSEEVSLKLAGGRGWSGTWLRTGGPAQDSSDERVWSRLRHQWSIIVLVHERMETIPDLNCSSDIGCWWFTSSWHVFSYTCLLWRTTPLCLGHLNSKLCIFEIFADKFPIHAPVLGFWMYFFERLSDCITISLG